MQTPSSSHCPQACGVSPAGEHFPKQFQSLFPRVCFDIYIFACGFCFGFGLVFVVGKTNPLGNHKPRGLSLQTASQHSSILYRLVARDIEVVTERKMERRRVIGIILEVL